MDDLQNATLKVAFPNTVFLVIDHDVKTSAGPFSFDFYYIDNAGDGESGAPIDGFLIEKEDIIGKL